MRRLRVLAAVEFDDEFLFEAAEVGYVAGNRLVSPKLMTREVPVSQLSPEGGFGVSLSLPECPGKSSHPGIGGLDGSHGRSLLCLDSGAKRSVTAVADWTLTQTLSRWERDRRRKRDKAVGEERDSGGQ